MNEITRIHLAKVAYDIEVSAKKQLEKYISSLQTYTADKEVLEDIEIRMTELLAERGVMAGGVVSSDDVKAIRDQLGEPHEFASDEGDIAVGTTNEGKRFFRNTDDAILGGVLSGFATYLAVDVIWVRIAFIILTFISFGLAVFLYVILWIITPAAVSATDKLRQAGRPVTVESIRELNKSEAAAPKNSVAPTVKRVLSAIIGTISLLGALGVLTIVIMTIFGISTSEFNNLIDMSNIPDHLSAIAWLLFGLVILGLILLAALFSLAAYAFFTHTFTKRVIISGLVIIVLGLTTFAATIGIAGGQAVLMNNEAQSFAKDAKVALPSSFSKVTSLTIEETTAEHSGSTEGYVTVDYVVTDDAPRYELHSIPGVKPVINVNGDTATVKLVMPNDFRLTFVNTRLVIYGPALAKITNNAEAVSYSNVSQDVLEIINNENASLSVNSGKYNSVKVSGTGNVELGLASVVALDVEADEELIVNAGTVRDLTVKHPDVCPAGSGVGNSVSVEGVTSERIIFNGEEREAKTYRTSCSEVIVGQEFSTILN